MVEGNVLTVGGITVDRPSGKRTVAIPIAQYQGLTDKDLAEFWDWLEGNKTAQAALAECSKVLAEELVAFGKQR